MSLLYEMGMEIASDLAPKFINSVRQTYVKMSQEKWVGRFNFVDHILTDTAEEEAVFLAAHHLRQSTATKAGKYHEQYMLNLYCQAEKHGLAVAKDFRKSDKSGDMRFHIDIQNWYVEVTSALDGKNSPGRAYNKRELEIANRKLNSANVPFHERPPEARFITLVVSQPTLCTPNKIGRREFSTTVYGVDDALEPWFSSEIASTMKEQCSLIKQTYLPLILERRYMDALAKGIPTVSNQPPVRF